MKALILAAGGGANMTPFSETRPKSMLHVAGRPLLDRTLHMLRDSGFSEVFLVIGPRGDKVKEYFGDGENMDLSLNYTFQKKQDGIGKALLLAEKWINPGEHFLLVYSDVVTDENMFASVLQSFGISNIPVAGIVLPTQPSAFGNVYMDKNMGITKIVENPAGKGTGNYVLGGVFVLPYAFFSYLKKVNGDMTKALASLIANEGLKASIWEKGWIDIGYPWDILSANRMIMDTWKTSSVHHNIIVKDAKIKGPVHIEEGVEIRSGAIIQGPSFIGRGSYIGNNVLIRKYSSLGPESTVGFGVELKNCVLFGHSRIGRLSFIGDSVIGKNVDVGSGTMTINGLIGKPEIKMKINKKDINTGMNRLGAFVGDNSVLGCGHNLKPGSIIKNDIVVPHHFTFPKEGK